jgi:hypothetical protein
VLIGTQDNVTAASAIASIWPTFWDKLFAAKAYTSPAAIASLCKNADPINEHARLYCAFALFAPVSLVLYQQGHKFSDAEQMRWGQRTLQRVAIVRRWLS